MNIVNIGIEKTLVGGKGSNNAIERHKKYGEFVGHLDIISYAHKSDGLSTFIISDKVAGHPSNSCCKAAFFFDAVRVFKGIYGQRKTDLIICQDGFIPGLCGVYLKCKYNVRLEINFHGDHWDNAHWLKERPFINRIFLWISYYSVPRADGIRVVSNFIKEKLVKRGIEAGKIRVIPTPINAEMFSKFDEEKIALIRNRHNNKKIILFIGRLVTVKNLPMLITAFSQAAKAYPEASLQIVGNGPLRGELDKLISDYGLEGKVVINDPVPQAELADYYKAADLLVLTSFSEGMPNVLREAALCGLPLVSTRVSGADDIVKEGENGLLVPVGDSEEMAGKILTLLRDDGLRQKMSVKSRELALASNIDTTPDLVKFWEEIVGNKL